MIVKPKPKSKENMVMLIVAAKKNPIAETIGSERNTTYLISPNVVLKL